MANNHHDVNAHHDVGDALTRPANEGHVHPKENIPTRIASASGFAGPMDVPAERSRPNRDSGSSHDHPANVPVGKPDESLIGPQLGRGGTGDTTQPPVDPTCVYTSPGQPMHKYEKGADIAAANANFEDWSELLMRPRGGNQGG